MTTYPMTERTTAMRMRERMSYDREQAHAILDEAWHCTLSFVVNGEPRALPTLVVRIGETLYVHGSTGSRPLLAANADGLRVCLTVTHLDALILARSQFHHSANYRSVVVHGVATPVLEDDEKRRVLTALVEKIGAGRSTQTRPPSVKELAQTTVLALPLEEASVRARTGGVSDDEEDLTLPYWAGVLPLPVTTGRPIPAEGITQPLPSYLIESPWHDPAPMRGKHVVLEALHESHVDGLFAALGNDDQVWEFIRNPTPQRASDMAAVVSAALGRPDRVTWVQRDAATGEVLGLTSYLIDESTQSLEIGGTLLARKAWRTGVNTEAKLLLLERAFEVLSAVRVSWQTDIRNHRSQAAIERLGATREGTLRANRRRNDGSLRDSALYSMVAQEWPNARSVLQARLEDWAHARRD